jgi:hypothetical protein
MKLAPPHETLRYSPAAVSAEPRRRPRQSVCNPAFMIDASRMSRAGPDITISKASARKSPAMLVSPIVVPHVVNSVKQRLAAAIRLFRRSVAHTARGQHGAVGSTIPPAARPQDEALVRAIYAVIQRSAPSPARRFSALPR